ncbi:MAG: uroporphyrinogen-III synthase [Ignavibacteriales bacterium]|nr:MAG: uroporphyrinogen-III synthase [Ignavibacteriales bacterium]
MQVQLKNMLKDIIISGIDNCIFRIIEPGFAVDLILGSIYASVNRGIEKNINEKEMLKEREEIFNFIYEGMSSRPVDRPLKSKVIVLTRTEEQNIESAALLKSAGADIISFPVLKIIPEKEINLEFYLKDEPDYIVFMSGNAVKIFAEKLNISGGKINRKKSLVAAVGNKTAEECILNNFTPDIIPEENSADGLIKYFEDKDITSKKFLIPRSAQGRNEFIDFLVNKNAVPLPVNIYTTASPSSDEVKDKEELLFNSEIDVIVFTSPSAVKNFLQLTGARGKELVGKTKIAAIGPTTAAEIASHNLRVDIQPAIFSMEGLKDSLVDFYKRRDSDIKE